MHIPVEVLKAFKKPPPILPSKPIFTPDPLEKERIGCDPSRTSVLVSKPTRKSRGRFVTVRYRKTSEEFQQGQKLAKFEVFNNPSLWSH